MLFVALWYYVYEKLQMFCLDGMDGWMDGICEMMKLELEGILFFCCCLFSVEQITHNKYMEEETRGKRNVEIRKLELFWKDHKGFRFFSFFFFF